MSKANIVKWKESKKGRKILTHLHMDGRACVCLCVCLSRLKSWINFDGVKGSWWNFQDQSNSLQVIFWRSVRSAGLQGTAMSPKWSVSRKYIASLSFCPAGVCHTFLETLGSGLKSVGSRIFNFGIGPKIIWTWMTIKNYFGILSFHIK